MAFERKLFSSPKEIDKLAIIILWFPVTQCDTDKKKATVKGRKQLNKTSQMKVMTAPAEGAIFPRINSTRAREFIYHLLLRTVRKSDIRT